MNSESLISPPDSELPRIGITIGDAAGIGPEVTLKALSDNSYQNLFRPVIICDAEFLRAEAVRLALNLEFREFDHAALSSAIEVVDLKNLPNGAIPGQETAETGRASGEYIEKAVELWRGGKVDAISTAPISKKALAAGGYDFPGHTEFLAALTGTSDFAMSFFAEKLRVVLLSTHVPLTDAIKLVTKSNLVDLIAFSDRQFRELLNRPVSIAVAGLNPHASEGGMFGSEEFDEITPAIEECRTKHGIKVSGPFSPDTVFLRGFAGDFDAVVALYHDQATIAVKSLSFGSSVNVTLGLPLIRTSVDHGTAIDIAGKGVADESSMRAAFKLAARLFAIRSSVDATSNV
ncbi:MAG: 4-hydroxythreonine-4-phosphate dehydrogenase PdxA [Blastocatellia bacterium]|nr:4-hydroxythreonine-4-phosphate dehydrogenase PdxA [Blastocatellia bacterium]